MCKLINLHKHILTILMLRNKYLLSIVVLLISFPSIGQHNFILGNTPAQKISANSIFWLLDTAEKSEWEIIRRSAFSSFPKNELIKGKTSWDLWGRFYVVNQTTAHQVFILQIPKSGYATAYVQTNNSLYKLQTGSLLPLAERSIQANTNGFRIFIKTNERATIWVKLQSV